MLVTLPNQTAVSTVLNYLNFFGLVWIAEHFIVCTIF